jgi:signal transduction histidine kinase
MQANRLSHLVGGLLTLARADAGVEPAGSEPVDLSVSVRDAVRAVASSAQKRGIAIELETVGAPVCVTGDPESFSRLWVILLDNAIKYSHDGGAVRVRTGASAEHHNRVHVDVIDEGLGLDAEDLPHLFDRFYRGARARHHEGTGSGLGLAIARTIVERASGEIALRPGPDGRGTAASVVLPTAS